MSNVARSTTSCCTQFYEQEWVQAILGESFHPGGVELSGRLLDSLDIKEGHQVLDVACGIGTTVRVISDQYSGLATGLDFGHSNIQKAIELSKHSPLLAKFLQGSAESLPFPRASFDRLICECALSTFSNQQQVVKEFFRVLRAGGQVGISDMVLNGELPDELRELIAPWTCLENAKTARAYQQLFLDAGFQLVSVEDESRSLKEMLADLKRKLLMAGLGKALHSAADIPPGLAELDIRDIKSLLDDVGRQVDSGNIEYYRLVFAKDPVQHFQSGI